VSSDKWQKGIVYATEKGTKREKLSKSKLAVLWRFHYELLTSLPTCHAMTTLI
jgi:hypothetical protein